MGSVRLAHPRRNSAPRDPNWRARVAEEKGAELRIWLEPEPLLRYLFPALRYCWIHPVAEQERKMSHDQHQQQQQQHPLTVPPVQPGSTSSVDANSPRSIIEADVRPVPSPLRAAPAPPRALAPAPSPHRPVARRLRAPPLGYAC